MCKCSTCFYNSNCPFSNSELIQKEYKAYHMKEQYEELDCIPTFFDMCYSIISYENGASSSKFTETEIQHILNSIKENPYISWETRLATINNF